VAQHPGRRLVGMFVVIALVFGLITVRLIDVQAADREHYRRLGLDQRVHQVTIAAERGSVFDRNGNDLAVSAQRQSVWADPRHVSDPAGYAQQLAPLLGVDAIALEARLGQKDLAFAYLARQVENDVAKAVAALALPGIGFVPETKRYYPANPLAAPLLGFVGTDNDGLAGLEAGQEATLGGRPGRMEVEQDPKGRGLPDGERRLRTPVRGTDLVLTIDQPLQFEVERVLTEEVARVEAKGGMVVIADVRTGDVLAMATVDGESAFAPAHPADSTSPNRPLTDVFEPGSTNKVVTIAAAIEAGLVNPSTVLEVPNAIEVDGQEFEDVDPHASSMSVADIVRLSSNVGTIEIARMLGKERFDQALRSFGFGSPTGLGFPGEASGLLLPVDQYNATSLASMPIGSGIAVTAMQMLDVYLTIANDGVARAPRLVGATIDEEGNREEAPLGNTRRVVSVETARVMQTMLEGVVADGTGTKAQISGYRVAGKTGTARKPPYEKPPYRYVTSFAGFAPANDPHLAAIVVLDEPQQGSISGGQLAAPVFARIMQYALAVERVPAAPAAP
jgi:cell division protein FtsI (penicillin-binding protein 3)